MPDDHSRALGIEVVYVEATTKARSTPEALAEDAVIEFLVIEGWERHPADDNLFGHGTRSPGVWATLAQAFLIEQARH